MTEIAARMGTSQSAVARLEGGDLDVRLSTRERYAAALGHAVDWQVRPNQEAPSTTTANCGDCRSGSPRRAAERWTTWQTTCARAAP